MITTVTPITTTSYEYSNGKISGLYVQADAEYDVYVVKFVEHAKQDGTATVTSMVTSSVHSIHSGDRMITVYDEVRDVEDEKTYSIETKIGIESVKERPVYVPSVNIYVCLKEQLSYMSEHMDEFKRSLSNEIKDHIDDAVNKIPKIIVELDKEHYNNASTKELFCYIGGTKTKVIPSRSNNVKSTITCFVPRISNVADTDVYYSEYNVSDEQIEELLSGEIIDFKPDGMQLPIVLASCKQRAKFLKRVDSLVDVQLGGYCKEDIDELKKDMDKSQDNYNKAIAILKQKHSQEIDDLKKDYDRKYDELLNNYNSLEKRYVLLQQEREHELAQKKLMSEERKVEATTKISDDKVTVSNNATSNEGWKTAATIVSAVGVAIGAVFTVAKKLSSFL